VCARVARQALLRGRSTSPLDVTVSGFCRIAFVGVTGVVLMSCSADPSGDARREEASVRALGHPGTSVESIRSALTRRGYECADGSGEFVTDDGSLAFATRYVACAKNVGGTLVCAYRMDVKLVPREGIADIHVRSQEICL